MLFDVDGTRSSFGRIVSAEIRGRMAARRISGKQLAALAGMSQNYLATRLRDEKPFTVDDIEALKVHIADDEDLVPFLTRAYENQSDEVYYAMETLARESSADDYVLAAMDRDDSEEIEAQQYEP